MAMGLITIVIHKIMVYYTTIKRTNSPKLWHSVGNGDIITFNLVEGAKGVEEITVMGSSSRRISGSRLPLPNTFATNKPV